MSQHPVTFLTGEIPFSISEIIAKLNSFNSAIKSDFYEITKQAVGQRVKEIKQVESTLLSDSEITTKLNSFNLVVKPDFYEKKKPVSISEIITKWKEFYLVIKSDFYEKKKPAEEIAEVVGLAQQAILEIAKKFNIKLFGNEMQVISEITKKFNIKLFGNKMQISNNTDFGKIDNEMQKHLKHGIPFSIAERNQLITNLCLKDGKTDLMIASIVRLSQQEVSKILLIQLGGIRDIPSADKRRKLTPQDIIVILKLLIGGEQILKIAKNFRVSQGRISQIRHCPSNGSEDYWDWNSKR